MAHTARPNIILVMTDQQGGAMMGCAGHPYARTPAMDRLAAAGTRFDRAFCTTPQCSPSRAALFTGQYASGNHVRGNIPETAFGPPQLPTDLPSLGTLLAGAGYDAAYFGKWHLGKAHDAATNPLAYGFSLYLPSQFTDVPSEMIPEHFLADAAADFITAHPGDRPFAVVASFDYPHAVYALPFVTEPLDTERVTLPPSMADDLAAKPTAQRLYRDENTAKLLAPLTPDNARRYLAWYTLLCERADGYLAHIVDALDARPDLAANTIVVFCSDHGDLACAHGTVFKGPMMYEELMRVPLIMRGPGIAADAVRQELVSLVDIVPTLCALAGVTPGGQCDGTSLTPLLHGDTPAWRDAVFGEYQGKQQWSSPIRMIRTDTHKLTRYGTGERELYDLVADPDEISNVVDDPAYATITGDLDARLAAWISARNDQFAAYTPTGVHGEPIAGSAADPL